MYAIFGTPLCTGCLNIEARPEGLDVIIMRPELQGFQDEYTLALAPRGNSSRF